MPIGGHSARRSTHRTRAPINSGLVPAAQGALVGVFIYHALFNSVISVVYGTGPLRDGERVPQGGAGVVRAGGRGTACGAGGGSASSSDVDGMPARRGSDAALAGRRPEGGGASATRFEDGTTHGAPDVCGVAGAGWNDAGTAEPVGVHGAASGPPPVDDHEPLAPGAGACGGGGRADPRPASFPLPRGPWLSACRFP